MGFRQVGQDEGQHLTRFYAQVMEGICRAGDIREELGVVPLVGTFEIGGIGEEA
ncbi:hypothetical protein D3C86_1000260 [compost metagenome]